MLDGATSVIEYQPQYRSPVLDFLDSLASVPTETPKIEQWIKKYSVNGKFRQSSHDRFSKHEWSWLFRSELRDLEIESDGDGRYFATLEADDTEAEADPGGELIQLSQRRRNGQIAFAGDSPESFAHGMMFTRTKTSNGLGRTTAVFPLVRQKLRVYDMGTVPGSLFHPQFDTPLIRPVEYVTVGDWTCPEYPIAVSDVRRVNSKQKKLFRSVGSVFDQRDKDSMPIVIGGMRWSLTAAERAEAERILRSVSDYDSKTHDKLAHFYEYGYRYYPGDFRQQIFRTVLDSKRSSDDIEPEKQIIEAPSGFYVRLKLGRSPERWYLVIGRQTVQFDDGDAIVEFESPVPMSQGDVYNQLWEIAKGIRSKSMDENTLKRRLREAWNDGELMWVDSPDSPANA